MNAVAVVAAAARNIGLIQTGHSSSMFNLPLYLIVFLSENWVFFSNYYASNIFTVF